VVRYESGSELRYDFRRRMRVWSILTALARAVREAITVLRLAIAWYSGYW